MNQQTKFGSVILTCTTLAYSALTTADVITESNTLLAFRNAYIDRDYKQNEAPISRAGSWTQGADLQFKSGYTEGPVKFGLDLSAQYAIRLDGGGGRGPDTIIPYSESKKQQASDYGHAAPTLKSKISETELKIGEFRPLLPVASIDDSRQLTTTFQGWQIESKELQKLNLTIGKYKTIVGRNSSNRESIRLSGSNSKEDSNGLLFAGGTYTLTPWLSGTYFYGQLEDIYQQHYFGLALNNNIGEGFTLKTDLRYYNSEDDGKALNGNVDNHYYGMMSSLKKSGHSIGIGYQRMLGETGFPLLNGYAAAPFLVNWSPTAFAKRGETSWQIRYDYDFATLGIPGLKFMNRLIKGANIHRANTDEKGSEWEVTTSIGYVIQSGSLKNLTLEWRHIGQDTNYSTSKAAPQRYSENRLITSYSFKF